jgi:large subunit ribosomal protein L13
MSPQKFWKMAGMVPTLVQQPAYYCHPVGEQLWHVFNAREVPLGRMASRVAQLLQGKHRPTYERSRLHSESSGDFVIIVNGRNPRISGAHAKKKLYRHHSGRPGGLKEYTILDVLDRDVWDRVVKQAVGKMLPKNNLRRDWLSRMHVYEEVYHDFKHIPQLLLREGRDDNKAIGLDGIVSDPEAYIDFGTDLKNSEF